MIFIIDNVLKKLYSIDIAKQHAICFFIKKLARKGGANVEQLR